MKAIYFDRWNFRIGFILAISFILRSLTAQIQIPFQEIRSRELIPYGIYGESVSVSRNFVLVGSPGKPNQDDITGKVDIYYKDPTSPGLWEWVTSLKPETGLPGDCFGASVALYDNYALIGAHGDDEKGENAGAAYFYEREEGTVDHWNLVTKITAQDGRKDARFGYDVALDGSTAIIGAFGDSEVKGVPMHGSAYIYERKVEGNGDWTFVSKLMPSVCTNYARFGFSVGISGNVAVVGAYGDNERGILAGAAYVYSRTEGGDNPWAKVIKLTASDGRADSFFGSSVSISGDHILVGAFKDSDSAFHAGAVYLFNRNSSGKDHWGEATKIKASDASEGNYFGWATSVSEDLILVGAYRAENENGGAGKIYLASVSALAEAEVTVVQPLTFIQSSPDEKLGFDLDMDGDRMVVGAPSRTESELAGSVYISSMGLLGIESSPVDLYGICPGSEAVFSVKGIHAKSFQWEKSIDRGITWTIQREEGEFSGTTNDTLIIQVTPDMDSLLVRCEVQNGLNSVKSGEALLTLDRSVPELDVKKGIIYLDSTGEAYLSEDQIVYKVWDVCGNPDVHISKQHFDCEDLGRNLVTITASDRAGNSISKETDIYVIDTLSPRLPHIEDKEVDAFEDGTYIQYGKSLDPAYYMDMECLSGLVNNYTWGSSLDGAVFPPGKTRITWMAKDLAGNSSTTSFTIEVHEWTGEEKLLTSEVKIFPNPTRGPLWIDGNFRDLNRIEVYDIAGNLIRTSFSANQLQDVNLSGYAPGMYTIKLVYQDKTTDMFNVLKY